VQVKEVYIVGVGEGWLEGLVMGMDVGTWEGVKVVSMNMDGTTVGSGTGIIDIVGCGETVGVGDGGSVVGIIVGIPVPRIFAKNPGLKASGPFP